MESFMGQGIRQGFPVFAAFFENFPKDCMAGQKLSMLRDTISYEGRGLCGNRGGRNGRVRLVEGGAETMMKWVKRILKIAAVVAVLLIAAMVVWMVFNFAGFKAFLAG